MSDKVFIDTNILIYCYSNSEIDRQQIARNLISTKDTYISTQVIQELINTMTRKYKYSYADAEVILNENCQNNNLHYNTDSTILKACGIANQYRYSFYDSLIIAAAIESGCTSLYSEDLQHGQKIENTLVVINPFAK